MQRATWTKKNHKYIRKEGNRYIYPEDLNKTPKARKLVNTITDTSGNKVPIRGAAATKTIANRSNRYDKVSGERLSASEVRRRNATNSQGTTDYKQISSQKANRTAAANGKVVNPTYNMKDENGKTIFRIHSNDKVMPTAAQDYAKQQSSAKKQAKNRSLNGSNAKNKEYAKDRALDKKRKSSLNSQGSSSKNYEYAKEHDDWKNAANNSDAEHYSIRSRRKAAQYTSERPYYTDGGHGRSTATPESAKHDSELRNKHGLGTKYQYSAREANKETVNNASNKLKKKGYFTVQNGETKFVPSDDITMKKVSKGEKIVNKLKELFKKKRTSAK